MHPSATNQGVKMLCGLKTIRLGVGQLYAAWFFWQMNFKYKRKEKTSAGTDVWDLALFYKNKRVNQVGRSANPW